MNIFGDEGVEWAKYRWALSIPCTADAASSCCAASSSCHSAHSKTQLSDMCMSHLHTNPTMWHVHVTFTDKLHTYTHDRYFDPETVGLDYKGMMEDLEAAPNGSIVLLHGERVHILRCVVMCNKPARRCTRGKVCLASFEWKDANQTLCVAELLCAPQCARLHGTQHTHAHTHTQAALTTPRVLTPLLSSGRRSLICASARVTCLSLMWPTRALPRVSLTGV